MEPFAKQLTVDPFMRTHTHTPLRTHLSAAGQMPPAHQKPSPFAHVHAGADDLQTETTGAKGREPRPFSRRTFGFTT